MPWNKINSLAAECPECDSTITFVAAPNLGQTVFCALCGTRLEVAYLRPIMLDYADDDMPPEFNDFDYEDYDFSEAV
jgi:lysine biosynthesis protein LysW